VLPLQLEGCIGLPGTKGGPVSPPPPPVSAYFNVSQHHELLYEVVLASNSVATASATTNSYLRHAFKGGSNKVWHFHAPYGPHFSFHQRLERLPLHARLTSHLRSWPRPMIASIGEIRATGAACRTITSPVPSPASPSYTQRLQAIAAILVYTEVSVDRRANGRPVGKPAGPHPNRRDRENECAQTARKASGVRHTDCQKCHSLPPPRQHQGFCLDACLTAVPTYQPWYVRCDSKLLGLHRICEPLLTARFKFS